MGLFFFFTYRVCVQMFRRREAIRSGTFESWTTGDRVSTFDFHPRYLVRNKERNHFGKSAWDPGCESVDETFSTDINKVKAVSMHKFETLN